MIGCPNGDEMPARTGAMIPQSTYLSSGLVSAPDPQNYFAAIPRGSEEVGIDALSFSPDTAAKDTRGRKGDAAQQFTSAFSYSPKEP
jgi:hypothetical protein